MRYFGPIVTVFLLVGCGSTSPSIHPGHGGLAPQEGRAIDPVTGRAVPYGDFVRTLATHRHVYVGEHHTDPVSHQTQLDVLRLLADAGHRVAVAIEWLPESAQGALDAYVAGALDEQELLERVRWHEVWGHDFTHYGPILRWAKTHGLPVWALGADPALVRSVGRHGVDGLSPEDRDRLPPLDSGNPLHRAFFEALMGRAAAHHGGHPGGPHHAGSMDRYYLAQLVRDETMARSLATHLQGAGGDGLIAVVLAGRGHIDHGLGIPARAQALTGLDFAIVLPVTPESLPAHDGMRDLLDYPARASDFLWLPAGLTGSDQ